MKINLFYKKQNKTKKLGNQTHAGQTHDKIVRVRILSSPNNLLIGGIVFAKSYVLFDGRGKQNGLLIDHTNMSTQPFEIVLFEIATIDVDRTADGVVESLYELERGRLATAWAAHQGDTRAGLDSIRYFV